MTDADQRQVVIVQPEVPAYRIPFFDRLDQLLGGRLTVYSSPAPASSQLGSGTRSWWRALGHTAGVLPGIGWQKGVTSIPFGPDDVLVISGAPRSLSNLALLAKARARRTTTIWWGHYWSATSVPWRAAIRTRLMGFADRILFYTDAELATYLDSVPAGRRREAFALNNGIETRDILRLRAPYERKARGNRILFVGRLTEKAELDSLLQALAMSGCEDVMLDIVGDGALAADLKRMADGLGIASRITWHGESRDEEFISRVANRCALFVYPGGVGLSLIHALAYGLPAIIHDDRPRHMPEASAFSDGVNGLGFRRGDVGSLADAIARALGGDLDLEQMSAAAVETTTATYNVADMAARFMRALTAADANDAARRPVVLPPEGA